MLGHIDELNNSFANLQALTASKDLCQPMLDNYPEEVFQCTFTNFRLDETQPSPLLHRTLRRLSTLRPWSSHGKDSSCSARTEPRPPEWPRSRRRRRRIDLGSIAFFSYNSSNYNSHYLHRLCTGKEFSAGT